MPDLQDAEGGCCTVLAGGGQDARDVALIGAARLPFHFVSAMQGSNNAASSVAEVAVLLSQGWNRC